MSPMSDQPITLAVLAQFHREVILPDIQKVVEASEGRLRNEMYGLHDSVLQKLAKLETEYEALKAGLGRVEDRLERMHERIGVLERQYQDLLAGFHRLEERLALLEERLAHVEERLARVEKSVDELVAGRDKEPLRAEVADLRARVDSLQAQVRSLESRLEQRD